MITTGVIGRDQFEEALAAAAAVGAQTPLRGLAAPLDGTWRGRIEAVWDKVEEALRTAYELGRDSARAALDTAVQSAEDLLRSAGSRARDVQQALLQRAQVYLDDMVTKALSQVRGAISVGGVSLALTSVEIAQRVTLTGALKVTLTELFALTAEGEISLSAHYEIA